MNPDTKPSTILIVDDDRTVIEQLFVHFRRRNYEPIATAKSAVVEQTLNSFKVDLILLDLRMEGLNGYDIIEMLRARKINVQLLIITSYWQSEKERLKQVGISYEDVIEKPFNDFAAIEARINSKLNKVMVPGEVWSDYEDQIYYQNKTKIVIIDDEKEICDILKEELACRKYDVKCFTKGDEALNYLLTNDCDIAIVDLQIPKVSGDRLIARMLKEKPRLKMVPITAAYEGEMTQLIANAGMDPGLLWRKPFDLAEIIEHIKVLATELGTLG
jgi:DNA-binding response OmpR family regulator